MLEPPGPDESAAEARREAWSAVGVSCDELSSTPLTLGLPATCPPPGGSSQPRSSAVSRYG
ncbi:MAG: TIGR02679 domain-containing protein [Solirubrobacteraceae bacterium]